MTIEVLDESVDLAGRYACELAERHEKLEKSGVASEYSAEAAQWMQVKMLAEIARQLAIINEREAAKALRTQTTQS